MKPSERETEHRSQKCRFSDDDDGAGEEIWAAI
jgi:hypothetical protein